MQIKKDVLVETLPESFNIDNVIFEPAMRNTSAAIGYATIALEKKYGPCLISVFPADHHISDNNMFHETVMTGIKAAENEDILVTYGLQPTYPATGYGYINMTSDQMVEGVGVVKEFVEKPDLETAKSYLEDGNYFWNSGMFTWKSDVILSELKNHLPDLYSKLEVIKADFTNETVDSEYSLMEKVSVDYGILERSDRVQVVPSAFPWNDVGTFEALDSIRETDESGNIIEGSALALDSKNTTILGKSKLIAAVGLEDLIIIEEDDAILVLPKSRAQDVKSIVEELKAKKMNAYL